MQEPFPLFAADAPFEWPERKADHWDMLQPDFDPAPTTVRIHQCKYVLPCRARRCLKRATLVAEKTDVAGRHVRQIELCLLHCEIVIERERSRGLEISDRRNE
jgi:hypothetical protein